MKKIYAFIIALFAFSSTMWAQKWEVFVAKVGTTNYAEIAEAISDWKKYGGTLTLLSDCEYTTSKGDTISQDATLDLNGNTLTWNTQWGAYALSTGSMLPALYVSDGTLVVTSTTLLQGGAKKGTLSFHVTHDKYTNLSALRVHSASGANAKLEVESGCRIVGNFETAPTYSRTGKLTGLTSSVISIGKCAATLDGCEVVMQGDCKIGIYITSDAVATDVVCKNNTVTYTADASRSIETVTQFWGITVSAKDVVLEDNKVDMTAAKGTYMQSATEKRQTSSYALSCTKDGIVVKGDAGHYKVDASLSTSYSLNTTKVVSVEGGTFDGRVYGSSLQISNGKFSVMPDARTAVANHYFEKEGDYYVVKTGKTYALVLQNADGTLVPYAEVDANDCWNACSSNESEYTSVFIIKNIDIAVPAGRYVNICRYNADNLGREFVVTNNGNLRIQSPYWNQGGTFVNNGVMEVAGTAAISLGNKSSQTIFVKNNNSGALLLLNANVKYYNYFTITNDGGNVSVKGGKFQSEQAYNQIASYIADGYAASKSGSVYTIVSDTKIAVTVNGIGYGLYDGLKASSQTYPAVLTKDYVHPEGIFIAWDAYLDLNGHTLTLDAKASGDSQEMIKIGKGGKGGSLTVSGKGTIKGNCTILFSMSGSATDTKDVVSAITIGKDVTIEHEEPCYYAIAAIDNANPYGIVVNYDGKFRGLCPFYINGTLTKTEGKVPEFNIGKTAELECGDGFAYAAGYGIWNYEGTATTEVVGIEVRAGKFTMNGGSITCTADKPADDHFNGNGSTSEACAIAASQHETELPISVIINGGELKAYTPIYQANPQDNPEEAIDKVSVVVNDAKVYSTSKNIVWSANKKVVLNGGVYNLAPTAYAAAGKTVVANADAATKDMYPYTIGTIASDNTFTTAGEWNTASNWSAGAVASADVPVKIAADVTISAGTKAEAYGITVESGKKITIKEGGVLMIGKDGIDGITEVNQLFIEDGGALLISPVAEASKSHPQSTNEIKTTIREVKDEYNNGDATYQYIWKNIALPVQKAGMNFTPGGQSAVNVWDNDWKPISSAAEFGIPFRGYHITVHPTVEATVANPTYTFTGLLNGNDDATLKMDREGFHLFGNSWSAPLDVRELLNQIEHFTDSKVNTGVKVYISDKCTLGGKTYFDGQYVDITRDALSSDKSFADAFSLLGAHECFFLCSNASSSQVTLNYEKAVWNAMSASAKSSAPRRMVSSDIDEPTYSTGVWIELEASNGRNDVVRLFDSDKESSKKLMSEGPANVNIYAVTPSGEYYSSFYASDLTDTKLAISTNGCVSYTLSFRNVKGEPLYIKDIQTGVVTEMSEGNTYTFTAEPSTTSTRFRVVSRSEVTTDVDAVVPVAGKSGVYSLMGQYLGETSVWETLPAGVYIVNGTKVVK